MPITVTCQACGQSFQLRDEMAGRTVRCRCGRPLNVPDPAAAALTGILEDELTRGYKRPPKRDAPEYVAPKPSAAPGGHSALESAELFEAPKQTQAWGIALRSVVGVVGLGYGLVMLGFGGWIIVTFALMVWHYRMEAFTRFPWPSLLFVMIAICGLLLSVASVGVLIAKRAAGPRARFAAGMLVVLWIAAAALNMIVIIRLAADVQTQLSQWGWDFWKPLLIGSARTLTWAIIPLLIYLWCRFLSRRALTEGF